MSHTIGHSLLQNNQSSDKSRLTVLTKASTDCDISQTPQLSVGHLLSSPVLAPNSQGEEVLTIHLLMGHLNPGPFSNLWQLVACHSWKGLRLLQHVVAKVSVHQESR